MTELTEESLIAILQRLAQELDGTAARISLRPSHLIVPPAVLNRLLHRPPIAIRRGPRGRRLAMKLRARPSLWRMGL